MNRKALCVLVGFMVTGRATPSAVAEALTPEQRIERIEHKLTEYGLAGDGLPTDVEVRGRVRTADGSPLPPLTFVRVRAASRNTGISVADMPDRDSVFRERVPRGTVWVSAIGPGFAPAFAGPIDATSTNPVDCGELVLDRGFAVTLEAIDPDTGEPATNAVLEAQFWLDNVGLGPRRALQTDAMGHAVLTGCVDRPLTVTLRAPGYETTDQRFETLKPSQTLRFASRRGASVTGRVIDKERGQPVRGATIQILHQEGAGGRDYAWGDPLGRLAVSDESGGFEIRQLRGGLQYCLGVTAPGRESVLLADVGPGQSNLVVKLGPELVVRGRITGNLVRLSQEKGKPVIKLNLQEYAARDASWERHETVQVRVVDGVGDFQFTNYVASVTRVYVAGALIERYIDAPVADWVIDLEAPEFTNRPPEREVVFRFTQASAVPPRGEVAARVPDKVDPRHTPEHTTFAEITHGEARVSAVVGQTLHISPGRMIGYWFPVNHDGYRVTAGPEPMAVEIPVIPAGVICATVGAAHAPAGELTFEAVEVSRSPLRRDSGRFCYEREHDPLSPIPRKWVSGPLPLGGTYQVICRRGEAVCKSAPITLTEEAPSAEIELRFPVPTPGT